MSEFETGQGRGNYHPERGRRGRRRVPEAVRHPVAAWRRAHQDRPQRGAEGSPEHGPSFEMGADVGRMLRDIHRPHRRIEHEEEAHGAFPNSDQFRNEEEDGGGRAERRLRRPEREDHGERRDWRPFRRRHDRPHRRDEGGDHDDDDREEELEEPEEREGGRRNRLVDNPVGRLGRRMRERYHDARLGEEPPGRRLERPIPDEGIHSREITAPAFSIIDTVGYAQYRQRRLEPDEIRLETIYRDNHYGNRFPDGRHTDVFIGTFGSDSRTVPEFDERIIRNLSQSDNIPRTLRRVLARNPYYRDVQIGAVLVREETIHTVTRGTGMRAVLVRNGRPVELRDGSSERRRQGDEDIFIMNEHVRATGLTDREIIALMDGQDRGDAARRVLEEAVRRGGNEHDMAFSVAAIERPDDEVEEELDEPAEEGRTDDEDTGRGRSRPRRRRSDSDDDDTGPRRRRPDLDDDDTGPRRRRPDLDDDDTGPRRRRPAPDDDDTGPRRRRPAPDDDDTGPRRRRPDLDDDDTDPRRRRPDPDDDTDPRLGPRRRRRTWDEGEFDGLEEELEDRVRAGRGDRVGSIEPVSEREIDELLDELIEGLEEFRRRREDGDDRGSGTGPRGPRGGRPGPGGGRGAGDEEDGRRRVGGARPRRNPAAGRRPGVHTGDDVDDEDAPREGRRRGPRRRWRDMKRNSDEWALSRDSEVFDRDIVVPPPGNEASIRWRRRYRPPFGYYRRTHSPVRRVPREEEVDQPVDRRARDRGGRVDDLLEILRRTGRGILSPVDSVYGGGDVPPSERRFPPQGLSWRQYDVPRYSPVNAVTELNDRTAEKNYNPMEAVVRFRRTWMGGQAFVGLFEDGSRNHDVPRFSEEIVNLLSSTPDVGETLRESFITNPTYDIGIANLSEAQLRGIERRDTQAVVAYMRGDDIYYVHKGVEGREPMRMVLDRGGQALELGTRGNNVGRVRRQANDELLIMGDSEFFRHVSPEAAVRIARNSSSGLSRGQSRQGARAALLRAAREASGDPNLEFTVVVSDLGQTTRRERIEDFSPAGSYRPVRPASSPPVKPPDIIGDPAEDRRFDPPLWEDEDLGDRLYEGYEEVLRGRGDPEPFPEPGEEGSGPYIDGEELRRRIEERRRSDRRRRRGMGRVLRWRPHMPRGRSASRPSGEAEIPERPGIPEVEENSGEWPINTWETGGGGRDSGENRGDINERSRDYDIPIALFGSSRFIDAAGRVHSVPDSFRHSDTYGENIADPSTFILSVIDAQTLSVGRFSARDRLLSAYPRFPGDPLEAIRSVYFPPAALRSDVARLHLVETEGRLFAVNDSSDTQNTPSSSVIVIDGAGNFREFNKKNDVEEIENLPERGFVMLASPGFLQRMRERRGNDNAAETAAFELRMILSGDPEMFAEEVSRILMQLAVRGDPVNPTRAPDMAVAVAFIGDNKDKWRDENDPELDNLEEEGSVRESPAWPRSTSAPSPSGSSGSAGGSTGGPGDSLEEAFDGFTGWSKRHPASSGSGGPGGPQPPESRPPEREYPGVGPITSGEVAAVAPSKFTTIAYGTHVPLDASQRNPDTYVGSKPIAQDISDSDNQALVMGVCEGTTTDTANLISIPNSLRHALELDSDPVEALGNMRDSIRRIGQEGLSVVAEIKGELCVLNTNNNAQNAPYVVVDRGDEPQRIRITGVVTSIHDPDDVLRVFVGSKRLWDHITPERVMHMASELTILSNPPLTPAEIVERIIRAAAEGPGSMDDMTLTILDRSTPPRRAGAGGEDQASRRDGDPRIERPHDQRYSLPGVPEDRPGPSDLDDSLPYWRQGEEPLEISSADFAAHPEDLEDVVPEDPGGPVEDSTSEAVTADREPGEVLEAGAFPEITDEEGYGMRIYVNDYPTFAGPFSSLAFSKHDGTSSIHADEGYFLYNGGEQVLMVAAQSDEQIPHTRYSREQLIDLFGEGADPSTVIRESIIGRSSESLSVAYVDGTTLYAASSSGNNFPVVERNGEVVPYTGGDSPVRTVEMQEGDRIVVVTDLVREIFNPGEITAGIRNIRPPAKKSDRRAARALTAALVRGRDENARNAQNDSIRVFVTSPSRMGISNQTAGTQPSPSQPTPPPSAPPSIPLAPAADARTAIIDNVPVPDDGTAGQPDADDGEDRAAEAHQPLPVIGSFDVPLGGTGGADTGTADAAAPADVPPATGEREPREDGAQSTAGVTADLPVVRSGEEDPAALSSNEGEAEVIVISTDPPVRGMNSGERRGILRGTSENRRLTAERYLAANGITVTNGNIDPVTVAVAIDNRNLAVVPSTQRPIELDFTSNPIDQKRLRVIWSRFSNRMHQFVNVTPVGDGTEYTLQFSDYAGEVLVGLESPLSGLSLNNLESGNTATDIGTFLNYLTTETGVQLPREEDDPQAIIPITAAERRTLLEGRDATRAHEIALERLAELGIQPNPDAAPSGQHARAVLLGIANGYLEIAGKADDPDVQTQHILDVLTNGDATDPQIADAWLELNADANTGWVINGGANTIRLTLQGAQAFRELVEQYRKSTDLTRIAERLRGNQITAEVADDFLEYTARRTTIMNPPNREVPVAMQLTPDERYITFYSTNNDELENVLERYFRKAGISFKNLAPRTRRLIARNMDNGNIITMHVKDESETSAQHTMMSMAAILESAVRDMRDELRSLTDQDLDPVELLTPAWSDLIQALNERVDVVQGKGNILSFSRLAAIRLVTEYIDGESTEEAEIRREGSVDDYITFLEDLPYPFTPAEETTADSSAPVGPVEEAPPAEETMPHAPHSLSDRRPNI
jgi:hypothetical protein